MTLSSCAGRVWRAIAPGFDGQGAPLRRGHVARDQQAQRARDIPPALRDVLSGARTPPRSRRRWAREGSPPLSQLGAVTLLRRRR
eukprot:1864203-Prymnesium_polylepis.1